jgi:hypothetical protein
MLTSPISYRLPLKTESAKEDVPQNKRRNCLHHQQDLWEEDRLGNVGGAIIREWENLPALCYIIETGYWLIIYIISARHHHSFPST